MKPTIITGIVVVALFLFILASTNVIASPNQPNENPVGYEYLDDGAVIHIWNENDDYYFDADSAIQLTNHYDEYWTKNVFCGGYKATEWQYFCTDDLPIALTPSTDNETYVNLTGYRNVTIGNKAVRFTLTYYLETEDADLTVKPAVTNLGSSINKTLGFAWKVTDIQISLTEEDDWINVDEENYTLYNDSLNRTYTDLDEAKFILYDTETQEYLYLKWNEALNYVLQVKDGNSYNANIMLLIKFNGLEQGQTKTTNFYWLDSGPGQQGTCELYWISGTTESYAEISDGENATLKGALFRSSGTGDCLRKLCIPPAKWQCKIYARMENSNDWVYTGITSNWQQGDCNSTNIADGTYDLLHDNKTDFRVELWSTNGYGNCNEVTTVMSSDDYKLDIWDDEHTPYATNVQLEEYYDTDENVTCEYTFNDADGDSENTTKRNVQWYVNGEYESSYDDEITIDSQYTESGQTWKCKIKVYDDVFTTNNEEWSNFSNEASIITKVKLHKTDYISAGRLIAKQQNSTNELSYYHSDYLGSTSLITNEAGEVESKEEYEPFGTMFSSTGNFDRFKYTGKEYDEDLDMHYFLARNYVSQAGRFTGIDPMLNPAISPYSYANNNPFKYVDPSGKYGVVVSKMHSEIVDDSEVTNFVEGVIKLDPSFLRKLLGKKNWGPPIVHLADDAFTGPREKAGAFYPIGSQSIYLRDISGAIQIGNFAHEAMHYYQRSGTALPEKANTAFNAILGFKFENFEMFEEVDALDRGTLYEFEQNLIGEVKAQKYAVEVMTCALENQVRRVPGGYVQIISELIRGKSRPNIKESVYALQYHESLLFSYELALGLVQTESHKRDKIIEKPKITPLAIPERAWDNLDRSP